MQKQLIANKWQCPDGTILHSKTGWDFVEHKDESGEYFALDGGNNYSRVVGDITKLKNLCVYSNDQHEVIRENFTWKSYGKDGKQAAHYILLKDITEEHLSAILSTQRHIVGTYVEKILKDEVAYRENHEPK
jgi:hypothetical protein